MGVLSPKKSQKEKTMANRQPNSKNIIGKTLNFQTSKQKYEVVKCDGVDYGEKGYVFECICIESPSKTMIGQSYSFDARAWKDHNNNNIKVESTLSARELLAKVLHGKYANTTTRKIGKITKDIAYELAEVNNGAYCGETTLTIVKLPKKAVAATYKDFPQALKEVDNIKALKEEHILIAQLLKDGEWQTSL